MNSCEDWLPLGFYLKTKIKDRAVNHPNLF